MTLLSVIVFTGRPFPQPTFTGARGAYKQHLNYSYHRVQKFISAIPKTMFRLYSTIIFTCYPFQSSRMPLLRVVLTVSSLLMLQNYKKKLSWCLIDWQLSVPNINGHAYSYRLPPLWRWGLNLDLNGIERVIINLIHATTLCHSGAWQDHLVYIYIYLFTHINQYN